MSQINQTRPTSRKGTMIHAKNIVQQSFFCLCNDSCGAICSAATVWHNKLAAVSNSLFGSMQHLGGAVCLYLLALALAVSVLMMYRLVAEVLFLAVSRRLLKRFFMNAT
jgi:hypothetical protein